MLAQLDSGFSHLSEEELALVQRVKSCQVQYGVSLHDLTAELDMDRHALGSILSADLGIYSPPDTLPDSIRAMAVEKLSAWVADREEQEEIIERAVRRMAGVHTRASLAKYLSLPIDALSQLLHGKTGNWSARQHAEKRKMLAALSVWLDSDDAADVSGFAATPTFERLQTAYNYAFRSPWTVSVVGEVGIGKSVAAKHYLRQNPKTRYGAGVVYVELMDGDTSRKAVLARIVQALFDLEVIHTAAGDPMMILADNLGPDDLLIVDEFQFALAEDPKAGKPFHTLANRAKTHVVLQGNPLVDQTLWNEKNQELEGLASRTSRMPYLSTTREDVEAWMQWAGYDDPALISAAAKIAARRGVGGGLRALAKLFSEIDAFFPGEKLTARSLMTHAQTFGHFLAR